jgi:hypothetical protein
VLMECGRIEGLFRSRSGFGVCKIKFENWVSLGVCVFVGCIGSRTTS